MGGAGQAVGVCASLEPLDLMIPPTYAQDCYPRQGDEGDPHWDPWPRLLFPWAARLLKRMGEPALQLAPAIPTSHLPHRLHSCKAGVYPIQRRYRWHCT